MSEINDTDFTVDSYTEYNNVEEYKLPETVTYILLVLHTISSGISLSGNVTIIIQNAMTKRIKSPVNYYLTSMAFSGILLVVFCVPFTVMMNLVNYTWIFGRFVCSTLSYAQTASVIQCSFTLMASSVNRHLAICRPFRPKQSARTVNGIILGIWIASFAIPAPIAYFSTIVAYNDTKFCVEVWPTNTYRQSYSSVIMILTYGIPLLVLMVTYGHITVILSKRPPGEECEEMVARRCSARNKNIKVFLLAFGAYCVCWLPIHVITIVGDVNPSIYDLKSVHVLWLFAHWMAMSNSAVTAMITIFLKSMFSSCLSKVFRKRTESDVSHTRAELSARRMTHETIL
ncbi:RYamide receptor-like [Mercenaria mercenaria]|uniref:RYamide receptor-like n=1 Tax=Mercenaria mercenaria TaxID=6596 RepID=UPI00234E6B5C|nr:RYamide receptor-like [Mercenaria mercenaria]